MNNNFPANANMMLQQMWNRICCLQKSVDLIVTSSGIAWNIVGNTGLREENFLGTTDVVDFILKTDSEERLRVKAGGFIGVGTDTPTTAFDINGQLRIRGGNPGANKILTSSADGTATWEVPAAVTIGADNGLHINSGDGKVYWGGTLLQSAIISSTNPNNKIVFTGKSNDENAFFGVSATFTSGPPALVMAVDGDVNEDIGLQVTANEAIRAFGNNLGVNATGGTAILGSGTFYGGSFSGATGLTASGTTVGANVFCTGGNGIEVLSTTGDGAQIKVNLFSATPLVLWRETSGGGSVRRMIYMKHTTNDIVGDGLGMSIDFQPALPASEEKLSHQIISKWTSMSSITSQYEIWGRRSDTFEQHFTLKGTGQLQLNRYTGTNFTGTVAKTLAVDSAGNIIMTDAAGGTLNAANKGLSLSGTTVQLGQNFGTVGNPALIGEIREIPISVGTGSIILTAPSQPLFQQTFTSNSHTLQGLTTASPNFQMIVGNTGESVSFNWNNTDSKFSFNYNNGLVFSNGIIVKGNTSDPYGFGDVGITTFGRTGLAGSIASGGFNGGIGDASYMTVNAGVSEGFAGVYSWPQLIGTGQAWKFNAGHKFPNYICGFSSLPAHRNPGATLDTFLGHFNLFNTDLNCSVTKAYDFYASEINTANYNFGNGVVTNHYAFYSDPFTYATNNYGVYINGTQKNYIGGSLGIGIVSAAAKIDIIASTGAAGTAPIGLASGTLLAVLRDGALEYGSSHLWFTIGGTRYQLDRQTATFGIDSVLAIGQSLTALRTIETGGFGLEIFDNGGGTVVDIIPASAVVLNLEGDNTNATGVRIANMSGTGLNISGASTGAFIEVAGTALLARTTANSGISFQLEHQGSNTNQVDIIGYFIRHAGNVTVTDNFGGAIDFKITDSPGGYSTASRSVTKWNTFSTHLAEQQFWVLQSTGVLNQVMTLLGTKAVKLNGYGAGTFTGTATRNLQVDSSGNIIEQSVALVPVISTGTAAPATTPGKVGDMFIDTTNKKLYFATGTASSADWTIAN